MPRKSRIDAAGALHHVMVRGTERGLVFRNPFKSIVGQENAYLLELVRSIHLNPIRACLVENLDELGRYAYCGHSVSLIVNVKRPWQETQWVLGIFGKDVNSARRAYRAFVEK